MLTIAVPVRRSSRSDLISVPLQLQMGGPPPPLAASGQAIFPQTGSALANHPNPLGPKSAKPFSPTNLHPVHLTGTTTRWQIHLSHRTLHRAIWGH